MARDASGLTVSMSLVEYLREQGRTLRDIGEMVGLSESFISRVANGHRSFTIDHLEVFERRLGQPLTALLLEAKWRNSIPDEKRGKFEEVLGMLRDLGELRTELGMDQEVGKAGEPIPGAPHSSRSSSARRAVG